MTYQETLDFLYGMLPMYQRVGKAAYKKDLSNTIALLRALDDPHTRFKSVHVAGTNGKGTSAHGIAAVLQTAGYKTGLYTSPHLKNFTERIRIDGQEIAPASVCSFVEQLSPHIKEIKPSFFEVTVAMAFWYFEKMEVDIAVIETGLGGRLDSTNVITPEVSLITNIGLDHTDLLGDTKEKIAVEKAGIIKDGTPVVIGEYQKEVIHVFQKQAEALNAEVILPKDEKTPGGLPYYKSMNLPGITGVIAELREKEWKISDQDFEKGMMQMEAITGFKGRFQVLRKNPLIVADVSHNVEGLELLFDKINALQGEKLFLIFGTVKDKDLNPIFRLFPKSAETIWTQSGVPRALPVHQLESEAEKNNLRGPCFADVNEALGFAESKAGTEDIILITGSTFVVADLESL